MELEVSLKKYFGYSSFRPLQKEIVQSILAGRDTIALLPTGAGKSICFQLPALLLPGMTLVVSPLIALMQDQVDNLLKKRIQATYLSSTLSEDEVDSRVQLMQLHKYKVLYVAPERLESKSFSKIIQQLHISLVVIDEAHCISMWGQDFRPSYLKISDYISSLPLRPIVAAFTATATRKTITDIQSSLDLHAPQLFRQSFLRKNLFIQLFPVNSYQQQEILVLLLLQKFNGKSGIIYAATHAAAEYLVEYIKRHSSSLTTEVDYYHGGLKASERTYIQKLFIAEKIKVVVATTAFGMGIDKSNIRFVIHYNYPASIEGYYQEIGRAGRDGEASYCYLLFNPDNRSIHEHLAAQSNDFNQQKRTLQLLKKMEKFCTSSSCRMVTLLEYFNEKLPQKCGNCDKCRPTQFLTDVQIKKFKQLQIVRSQLQKKFKLGHEAEVLTDNQLLQLVATNPVSIEDFLHLTGFGKGWLDRWHNHFLSIDVKIQIDTHQGKYV